MEAGKLESLLRGRQAREEADRQLAILKSVLAQLLTDLEHALRPDQERVVHAEPNGEQVKAV